MKPILIAALLVLAVALMWTPCCRAADAPAQTKSEKADKKDIPCIEDEEKYNLAVDEALARMNKAQALYEKKKDSQGAVEELLAVIDMAFCPTKNKEGFDLKLLSITTCAQIYMDLKKPEKAEKLLLDGIEVAPLVARTTASLYATLAKAYEQLGKEDEAIAASDKALQILDELKKKSKKEDAKKDDKK